jgi:hypothetical protein
MRMTVRRPFDGRAATLTVLLALTAIAAACMPGASTAPAAVPSASDAMMEHSASPSDAMMEHSPAPSGS